MEAPLPHGGTEAVIALAERGNPQVTGNQHDPFVSAGGEVINQGCHGGLVIDAHLVHVQVREAVKEDQGLFLLADPLKQHGA